MCSGAKGACALMLKAHMCRRAMLHFMLMPTLRFAPVPFQVSALKDRAPILKDILNRSIVSVPLLM